MRSRSIDPRAAATAHCAFTATFPATREVRELADGYAFRYATDETIWLAAAEYVDLERRCCPFFSFALKREAEGAVWLELTGQEGVKEFLATQLQTE